MMLDAPDEVVPTRDQKEKAPNNFNHYGFRVPAIVVSSSKLRRIRVVSAFGVAILEAIARGMTVVSGLHDFLGDDSKFAAAADQFHA